jgi:hypothetical protein
MKAHKLLPLIGMVAIVAIVVFKVGTAAESTSAPATPPVTATSTGGFVRPSPEALRARLTPLQYDVTQNEGTEPSFRNEYWDNKQDGIYVDVVSGEPLFSSSPAPAGQASSGRLPRMPLRHIQIHAFS